MEEKVTNSKRMENIAWATGITLHHIDEGWFASCSWRSSGNSRADVMEGDICTRYCIESLTDAIDSVLAFMEQMNVKRADELEEIKTMGFALYYDDKQTGELPENFKQELMNEAQRRGWHSYTEK